MLTRSRLWASVLLIATFAVGGLAGSVASSAWGSRGKARPDGRRREGFSSVLTRELNLTPVQRESVQTILRRYDPAMRAVWDAMRPRFDSLRAGIDADIIRVLDDQQRAAFQRFKARMDSMQARRRPRGGDSAR